MTQGPLAGVRVLDLSRVLAGPWATQTLADLGAEVIKIERPGVGDDTRQWGPPFTVRADGGPGDAAYFLCANRGKKSVELDIASPEGAAAVRRLAADCDVVVENFKVGGLKRFGLDYESLALIRPSLVYCSITGYGQDGPYAERGGYDFVAQGMGGIMSITGQPDGAPGAEPMKAGVAICDLFTGVYAATAVLAALRHAERTGEGQHVDCCLLDSQVAMLANQGMSYLVGGVVGQRLGNAHPTVVPYRLFHGADGDMVIAVGNNRQFKALCEVIGRPDIFDDPRYATNTDRIANRAALEASLAEALADFEVAPLIERLSDAGVPAGPINTIDKVFADPHVQHRRMAGEIARADGAKVPSVAYPPKLSKTPADYRRPPPRLGEDTASVLRDELGLDDAECARLAAAGVIGNV